MPVGAAVNREGPDRWRCGRSPVVLELSGSLNSPQPVALEPGLIVLAKRPDRITPPTLSVTLVNYRRGTARVCAAT